MTTQSKNNESLINYLAQLMKIAKEGRLLTWEAEMTADVSVVPSDDDSHFIKKEATGVIRHNLRILSKGE